MKSSRGREIKTPKYLQEYDRPVEACVRICDPESFKGENHHTGSDTDWMIFGVAWADAKQVNGKMTLEPRKMFFLHDVVDKVIRDGYLIKTAHMYKMLQFLRGGNHKVVTINQLIEKMGTKAVYVMHNAESDMKALKRTCEYMGIEFPVINYRCSKKFIDCKYYQTLIQDYVDENSVPFVGTKLETMYKWVTNNPRFVQSHLGDEDVVLLYKSLEKIAERVDSNVLKNLIQQ
jgi:hypothetical protein